MSECGSRRNTFYRLCVRVPFCRRSARPFFYPDVSLRWLSSARFTSCGVRCVRFVRHFGRMDHVFTTKDYSRPCLRPYYTNSKSLLRCFSGHPRSYLPVLSIYNEHISCDTAYIEDFFFYKSFTGCFLIRHKYAPVYGCILTAICDTTYIEDFFFYKSFTGCFLIRHKYAPVYGCIFTTNVCTRIQVHFRQTEKCVHEKHKPGYPAQTYRYRFTRSSRLWLRHPAERVNRFSSGFFRNNSLLALHACM